MLPFKLSKTSLRSEVDDRSWERAQDYYASGSVLEVVCRGNSIQAQVEGSHYEPYRVSLQVESGRFTAAHCSCPYDWGGWCKHIAAVGMVCCHDPEEVRLAAPVEDLLSPLDTEDLRDLILELVEQEPGIGERIEVICNRLSDLDDLLNQDDLLDQTLESQAIAPSPPAIQAPLITPAPRKSSIDPAPYRRQARQVIRDTVRAIEDGQDEYMMEHEAFPDLMAQPEGFINAGDGANALVILEAITSAFAEQWSDVEDYGYDGEIAVQALDPLWAEALLQSQLDENAAKDLQIQLEDYAGQLRGPEFPLASEALRQGWDDPRLLAVLQGSNDSLWEAEPPSYADELAQIRLRILARQNLWEEYIHFAAAAAQFRDWLVALIKKGEGGQALASIDRLETVTDAQAVAEAFRAQGNLAAAVQVVQRGIELPNARTSWDEARYESESPAPLEPGPKRHELAAWGAELAEQLEDEETTLELWSRAIAAWPKVADFQHLQRLADDQWPMLRDGLLDQLERSKGSSYGSEEIQIFLAEGRIQAAIDRVDNYYNRPMMIPVMAVAIASHSDWVIRTGTAKANEILDRGKADRYALAVQYLQQVKAAYHHQGNPAAWQSYRLQLQQQHGRKYKLMALMSSAGL